MCSTSVADVVGPLVDAEVGLQVGRLDRRPDPRAEAGQLRRVEHLEARVLVEQRLELGELVVALGAHHRRHEVVDDRRVRAALGLHALAGVVDDERVDERQSSRARRRARTTRSARASCPAVHSSVPCLPRWTIASAPQSRVEPAVAGQVVVGRRQLGVVVDPDRILAVAARRLDGDDDVAELEPRDHEVVAVDVAVARRRAPALLHRRAQLRGQRRVPREVVGDRQAQRARRRAARR